MGEELRNELAGIIFNEIWDSHEHVLLSYDPEKIRLLFEAWIADKWEADSDKDNFKDCVALYAREACIFVAEELRPAYLTMLGIVLRCASTLVMNRIARQKEENRAPDMLPREVIREMALKQIGNWINDLDLSWTQRGPRPKSEKTKSEARAELKKKVIDAMLHLLNIPERISQEGVAKILGIGNTKKTGSRTLYNRLKANDLVWRELVAEAKVIYAEKRTKI